MKVSIFKFGKSGIDDEYEIDIKNTSIENALKQANLEIKEGERLGLFVAPALRPGYNG